MGRIMIINGQREVITCPKDFGEVIEKYMGDEAARYYVTEQKKLVGALRNICGKCEDSFQTALEAVDEYA